MAKDSDAMLVEACLAGDRSAFEPLVEKYEAKLYNATYRITGRADDAWDATQAAFVKAWEKLDTFDPTYRFFSWIYRIAVNEALNLIRRGRRETELDDDLPFAAAGPDEAYGETETAQLVERALMRLKPEHRVLIVLAHFHELSYEEMSEVTGVPSKTVKSRLFSARRSLGELLRDRGLVRR